MSVIDTGYGNGAAPVGSSPAVRAVRMAVFLLRTSYPPSATPSGSSTSGS